MFLDTDRKILFIHNPKAAGTSIRSALVEIRNTNLGYNTRPASTGSRRFKIKHDDIWLVSTHSFASRLRMHPRIRDHYRDMFTFGVVRNPWDRAVSLWEYGQQVISGQTVLRAGLRGMTEVEKNRAYNECASYGFPYFLTEFCDRYRWNPWDYLGPHGIGGVLDFNQIDWFQHGSEEIVSRIYRMDSLSTLEVEMTRRTRHPVKFDIINATKHAKYQEFYSGETKQWVAKRFARDIKRFGFEFG